LARVPGATVDETEAGGPYSTPYHAHITTPAGQEKVVLVNTDFQATAVQDAPDHGGFRGHDGDHRGIGGPGRDETPLTGDKAASVKAAVLDTYPRATIERVETNGD